jgi:hypothetical protein
MFCYDCKFYPFGSLTFNYLTEALDLAKSIEIKVFC